MTTDAIVSFADLLDNSMKFRLGSILVGLSLMVMPHQIATGAQASQSDADYVLGPGDVLSVNDNAGSTTNAPILPDGTAVINQAGVIEAAGMTVDAVNKLVNQSAKKWSEHPNIVVRLDHRGATRVYVLGAVSHPGLYAPPAAADESSGLDSSKKHLFTISEALQFAGGVKEGADISHIHVTRQHPKQVIDVDLWKLMLIGEVNEDLALLSGDVIFVPRKGTESSINHFAKSENIPDKVRVLGAIKHSGLFAINHQGEKLMSVIARAGGFDVLVKRHTIVIARKRDDGSISTERVMIGRHPPDVDSLLKPGDVVFVENERLNPAPNTLVAAPNPLVGDFGKLVPY